ncbi:hypothetical protein HPB52_023297 [Rhipicephalus sanguineus]|uniref:CCHC-type domain-containing protein n=1 Tax=Rhipicephalus sanguineus TaxID=34632 RepID=A0A9D4YQY0_RHISA|nr:hypothetical protein HPB52_023297 [Rhipicephalus sanguineus]
MFHSCCALTTGIQFQPNLRVVNFNARSEGQIGAAGSSTNIDSLCGLVRSVACDELQKIRCPSRRTAGSKCSLIGNEVQQALQVPLSSNVPPVPMEPRRASYAEAVSRCIPASPRFVNPAPHDALPSLQPIHHLENRQSIQRKYNVWRTPDRRPLCYHGGEAGHLYRECPYHRLGQMGFAVDLRRSRFGETPRAIEEYVSLQRMPLPLRRQSCSPIFTKLSGLPRGGAGVFAKL